jgi:hypothetical protein
MNRRRFLESLAAGAAALNVFPVLEADAARGQLPVFRGIASADQVRTEGHTLLCTFSRRNESWNVYEDLTTRDGSLTFVSSEGEARVLRKTAEPTFPEGGAPYLGLDLKNIGMSGPDLLADKLLSRGDPDEDEVRRAVPPMDSAHHGGRDDRPRWNTIVGTRECSDTMPVYPGGNTRTYHPAQYFKELTLERAQKRHEGLVGGWMPAVRKVIPGDDGSYYEVLVFGDVLAKDRFIVQTWHRTAQLRDGKIIRVEYGYSYPAYTRRRQDPKPEEFYRGLLEFAEYWERQLRDLVVITLPDASWADMVAHAFAKEIMVRPGGTYPKYGAVDRDYYGPEYDGFQDIFTMSLYANLECGRFVQARDVFDNYFSEFVDDRGMINMRGPETAQFGLTLSLIARYYNYTRDAALMRKWRAKIEATAAILVELHDEALALPASDRGCGLIHGWCESDSCLAPNPAVWNQPYFADSAFAIRGWRDIAAAWRKLGFGESPASDWSRRAAQLQKQLVKSIQANVRTDKKPFYIGPLPGTKLPFRESLAAEHPSEQQWTHRCYAELLQADVLSAEQAELVIDCMRAYGATTVGVVANVEPAHPNGRDILGFISYGYAQMLLRLDRIEEFILFLYAHRYHDHSRGSWTAGEVAGITGDDALFCIPAQQTIPLLVRWMLVFEDSEEDRLYFGRAIPRAWIKPHTRIAIEGAPTRWGRVDYKLVANDKQLVATIVLPEDREPAREIQVSFRVPEGRTLANITANGAPTPIVGKNNDAALIATNGQHRFEVVAEVR